MDFPQINFFFSVPFNGVIILSLSRVKLLQLYFTSSACYSLLNWQTLHILQVLYLSYCPFPHHFYLHNLNSCSHFLSLKATANNNNSPLNDIIIHSPFFILYIFFYRFKFKFFNIYSFNKYSWSLHSNRESRTRSLKNRQINGKLILESNKCYEEKETV